MDKVITTKNLSKAADEAHDMLTVFGQRLLELEVLVSRAELATGKGKRYKSAQQLLTL